MKKEEYKKEIDDIKISENEKAKIYNNIQNELNKKKGFSWGPIVGFGAIALASFGMFMILGNNNGNNNGGGNNPGTSINRNISLENSYRKDIIVSAKSYLEANKVDLDKLNNGEEIIIEGTDIVDNEKYGVCSGKLVVKKYNDDFEYSTNVTCEGEDKDNAGQKEYVIYKGILDNVFELGDYIAVSSINNYKKPYMDIIDCDANFTVLDKEGKVVFNKLIKSVYEDEDSTVYVRSANMINGKYYLVLELDNEIHFNKDGSGSLKNNYYILILNEKGEEVEYKAILDKDGKRILIDEYIGGEGDYAYYTGSVLNDDYTSDNVLIRIDKDETTTIKYEAVKDLKNNIATHTVIDNYYDGNYYGYKYDKSYAGKQYYSAKSFFQLDNKGEVIFEKELPKDENIIDIKVSDNIYVLSSEFVLYKYDLKGTLLTSKQFDKGVSMYINKAGKVVICQEDTFTILDDSLDMSLKVDVDFSDIDKKFEWGYKFYSKLNDNSVISAFSVSENIDNMESVLLVFEQ